MSPCMKFARFFLQSLDSREYLSLWLHCVSGYFQLNGLHSSALAKPIHKSGSRDVKRVMHAIIRVSSVSQKCIKTVRKCIVALDG